MEGDVLVWPVSGRDTAAAGSGTMEVLGVADSQRKLSAIATTRVLATTTVSTTEPPEALRPSASIPETTDPHMQLVTDADGKMEWQERLAYEDVSTKTFCEDFEMARAGVDGGVAIYAINTPFAEPFTEGIFTVEYGEHTYTGRAASLAADTGIESYVIGNANLVEGNYSANPDPAANFELLYIPAGMDGMYGLLATKLTDAETISLTVTGETGTIKKLDAKYLPHITTPQITITTNGDSIVSDTPFDTAWAMTDAELQAGITVKRVMSNASYINVEHFAVSYLTRREVSGNGIGFRHIQFRTRSHKDFSDPAEKDIIRCYTWTQVLQDGVVVGDGVALSNEEQNGNYIVGATRETDENGILYAEMSVAYDVIDRKIHEGKNVVVWLNDTTTDEDTIVMYFSGLSSSHSGLIFRDLMNTRIILYLSSNEDQHAGLVIPD
jgi:hypothetical protein